MSSSLQSILITGANQGLGYFTALQLSKLPGYHIFVGARSTEKGAEAVKNIEADGPTSKVELILVDVDSDESINAAIKQVEAKAGRLDALVVCPLTFVFTKWISTDIRTMPESL
jgi:NAD(P)-dependent dehydrogenase (short-subunit alcohol dehydrogenase family)